MGASPDDRKEIAGGLTVGLPCAVLICLAVFAGCDAKRPDIAAEFQPAAMDKRITELTTKVSRNWDRFSVETLSLKKRAADLESRADDLSARIGGGLTDLQDDVRGLDQRVIAAEKNCGQSEETTSRINAAHDAILALRRRVDALESKPVPPKPPCKGRQK